MRKEVFLEASCGFVICHKGFRRIVLKRVCQRFVESCGFSPGTPVSTTRKVGRIAWVIK